MWSREGSVSSHQSQTERLTCAHKGDDCNFQRLILLADVRGPSCQQNEMLYSGESTQTSLRIKNITHGVFNKYILLLFSSEFSLISGILCSDGLNTSIIVILAECWWHFDKCFMYHPVCCFICRVETVLSLVLIYYWYSVGCRMKWARFCVFCVCVVNGNDEHDEFCHPVGEAGHSLLGWRLISTVILSPPHMGHEH